MEFSKITKVIFRVSFGIFKDSIETLKFSLIIISGAFLFFKTFFLKFRQKLNRIFEKLPLFLKLSCVDLYNFSNHPFHGTEGRPLAVGMDTGHVRTTVSALCSFFQFCSTWKLF